MKKHINFLTFILFFFTSVTYSIAQSTESGDSIQQESNTETNNDGALDTPGDMSISGGDSGSTGGQSSESATEPQNTDNELLNAVMNNNNAPVQEYVKGTRLPNEYASGRTGGQFSFSQNPATAKPKPNPNPESNNINNINNGNGNVDNVNQSPESETQEETK